MKIIDLGCGEAKQKGAIGIDRVKLPGVDYVVDLETEKLPFQDSSIDKAYAIHFLEHTDNFIHVIEEVWRVLKPGGKFEIESPHFTSAGAFRDPTHTRFFTYDTMEHFTDSPLQLPRFYTKAKFRIIRRKLVFSKQLPLAINYIIEPIANMFPHLYENSMLRIFPAEVLKMELEALK